MDHCCEAGTEYAGGGTPEAPVVYTSDGIARWATRGSLYWRRPCFSAAELYDLEVDLLDVPDDSTGWATGPTPEEG